MFSTALKTVVSASCLALSACHVYWGEEITGTVVDDLSGQPIQGAAVTVVWNLYGGLVHGNTIGPWRVDEVLTDADGQFRVRAWGPSLALWDGLHVASPTLMAGHGGYYFEIKAHSHADNEIVPSTFSWEHRACECGERSVRLSKLDGDLKRMRENAEMAERNLPLRPSKRGMACARIEAPNFTSQILQRSFELTSKRVSHGLPMGSC